MTGVNSDDFIKGEFTFERYEERKQIDELF